jgi:2-polyprenyl-3-methyl-5-hydroxy-6-metoxy-1,4-benzoquinol methylase
MLQYRLLERSPRLLRWYRTRLTLDWGRLLKYLPAHGRVLDVGCGVGSLDYEIGRTCMIKVLGIELDAVEGLFDCVLFVDVFHHVPPAEHKSLLDTCVRLLAPGGYVLIKDIERRRGHVSRWMDRYLSGCDDVYMYNCDELRERVSAVLPVLSSEVRFKPPFPHYYLKAGYASA